MERKTSRNLYLIGILLTIVATVLIFVAGASSVAFINPDGTLNGNFLAGAGALVIVSVILYIVAAILGLIAWVGALIKTARLSQWLWFVLLIILSWTGIMMLIYIFAGPTEAKLPVAV